MKTSKKAFCPDVRGACVGKQCIAFDDNMTIEVVSGNPLVKKVIGTDLDYNLPMTFSLKVGGCSKYGKIVDKDSINIFTEFKKELLIDEFYIGDEDDGEDG